MCNSTPGKGTDTSARVRVPLEIPFPSPSVPEVVGWREQWELSLYTPSRKAQAQSTVWSWNWVALCEITDPLSLGMRHILKTQGSYKGSHSSLHPTITVWPMSTAASDLQLRDWVWLCGCFLLPGPPALLHPALSCLVQEHCASVPRSWRWRGGGGGCGIWAKLWRDVRICHTTNDQERVGRLWTGKSDLQFDSVGEDAEFLSDFKKIFHLFPLPLRINQQIFRCLLVSVWKITSMPFRWWEFVRFWLNTISTSGISGKTLNLTL